MDNYEGITLNNTIDDNDMVNATLPPEMVFTGQSLTVVIVYCLCFLVSAIGNLTVFVTLSRGRYRKSRISLMICHLSAADLLVTFVMIPVEVGWRLTVQWIAGNVACKAFAFLRAFGLYLSSNILVCVSLDRYFAVLHPLRVNDARRRGKIMLILAWICSTAYAVPQCFIFHVLPHPKYPDYKQCVTFDSGVDEASYMIFCVLVMYFVPLVIMCWAYTKILCEIHSRSRETSDQIITRSGSNGTLRSSATSSGGSRMRLRRSDMSSIERARSRTLRMTITIVAVFIICWTPYVAMLLWYMMDRDSAEKVDQRLQDALFIMAVGNSCANPLVYGSYAVNLREECCRCFLPYNNNPDRSQTEVRLVKRNTGAPLPNSDKKSPGVSNFFVLAFRTTRPDVAL
ncbi:gonadotropin-releasing hormone II receptor-like isoform X2 [Venturia canescens]|uniref:gonadotropin-releasing hormone II receptor-like isoform X2 n=1 Tax=Venturia canescens TaxID=32260 RepID=UPI001C9BDB58|nr:gonadotropin-releasing hormone II receptor-like isoform X2 [Venturia canescens]XP_043277458.1 gonadotropin-releasing hormone II receptor-like isoform X2 [Venturia canescens]